MAKNIATFSAKFGLTDTLNEDMSRIKGMIKRAMTEIQKDVTDPFAHMHREVEMAGRAIEKLGTQAQKGFASQGMLTQLDQLDARLQSIANRASSMPMTASGVALMGNISEAQAGIRAGQISAVPSPALRAEEQRMREQALINQWSGKMSAYRANQAYSSFVQPTGAYGPEANYYGPAIPSSGWNNYRTDYSGIQARNMAWNRQADAYTRNMDPYSGTTNYARLRGSIMDDEGAMDLDPLLNARTRFGLRAQNLINDYQDKKVTSNALSASLSDRDATSRDVRARPVSRREVASQVREEKAAVDALASSYSKLSSAERDDIRVTSEMMRARGQAGYSLSLRALDQVDRQNRMGLGRGSGMHAFRYGSQNAAFALEDYMISSQFGGPKAGLRAITNNLTAMTAAATGFMNPLLSAGIIGGVAVAGASAPMLYDALTGDSDQFQRTAQAMATPRAGIMQQFQSTLYGRNSLGRGPNSEDLTNAIRSRRLDEIKRSEILRSMNGRTGILGTQSFAPSEHIEAMMRTADPFGLGGMSFSPFSGMAVAAGGAIDYLGGFRRSGMGPVDYATIREAGMARTQRDTTNKALSELGDPELLRLDEQAKRDVYNREVGFFNADSDLRSRGQRISAQRAMGRLVNPAEQMNLDLQQEMRTRNRIASNWAGTPEELQINLAQRTRSFDERVAAFRSQELPTYNRQLREQDWAYRTQMAGMQVSDVARIKQLAGVQSERIDADLNLTSDQKTAMKRLLEKQVSRQLTDADRMPDLGRAIGVGTAEDVSLRQNMFGGGERLSTEKQSIGLLESILRELQNLNRKKENRPGVAPIKKR